MSAGGSEGDGGAVGLLGKDGLELVGLDARPAVLLRDLDAEDAELAKLVVELAGHDACGAPVVVHRDDLGFDEVPDGLPEGFVVVVVDGSEHG